MRDLPNTTRPDSDGETSGEDGNIAASFAGKAFYEDLIQRANTVSIINIFKHYGVRLDANNRKTTCPFPSHKGGRERTPSFNYYPDTNTYCCFGCRKGSCCCDFVAEMDKIAKNAAAIKILDLFGSDIVDDIDVPIHDNFAEQFAIILDFSNAVRIFRQDHIDQKSFDFIENICKVYDDINVKHALNNEALQKVVTVLKTRISAYL